MSDASLSKPLDLPDFIEPQLATLVDMPPEGEGWLHEIKHDGYRLVARIGDDVRLMTRRGENWTERFQVLVPPLLRTDLRESLVDGEVVGLREGGISSFSALQKQLSAGPHADLYYFVFDLLFVDGKDIRRRPLVERKALLEARLPASEGRLLFSRHMEGSGPEVYAEACNLGVEGIVSKRADAAYVSGRSRKWLKTKCGRESRFVVAGYVYRADSPAPISSLILGAYSGDTLVHVGRVGTGFSEQDRALLREYLDQMRRSTSPFAEPPEHMRGDELRWVEPIAVAIVAYTEFTHDGLVRHPSFKGLTAAAPEAVQVAEIPGLLEALSNVS